MNRSEKIVELCRKNLDIYIAKRSKRKILSAFNRLKFNMDRKRNYEHFPLSLFSNLIVYAFKKDPSYFMKEIYSSLRYFLEIKFSSKSLKDIEIYILKNACFYDDEKLVFEFDGRFTTRIEKSGSTLIFDNSNVYITNRRIIIQSNRIKVGLVDTGLISYGTDPFFLKYYKNMVINQNYKKNKKNTCYGHEFSLYDLKDIRNDAFRVSYHYYDNGKKKDCEFIPKQNHLTSSIKQVLQKLNTDPPLIGMIRSYCEKCGALIKIDSTVCKNCQTPINVNLKHL
ncbi:MAG: zinc ribbon domain-containing protein [Candidatus Lokiarchaeota archaeon]|nr:zinc ribbon domain-containing protein [Candidatus Lokiarchaeota archaeon]